MLLSCYFYLKMSVDKTVKDFCVQEKGKLSTIQVAVLANTSKEN